MSSKELIKQAYKAISKPTNYALLYDDRDRLQEEYPELKLTVIKAILDDINGIIVALFNPTARESIDEINQALVNIKKIVDGEIPLSEIDEIALTRGNGGLELLYRYRQGQLDFSCKRINHRVKVEPRISQDEVKQYLPLIQEVLREKAELHCNAVRNTLLMGSGPSGPPDCSSTTPVAQARSTDKENAKQKTVTFFHYTSKAKKHGNN